MITGLADRESRLRALENGAEDYLSKPVDPAELKTRVRNHLRLKEYGDMLADFNRSLERRVNEKTAQLQDSLQGDNLFVDKCGRVPGRRPTGTTCTTNQSPNGSTRPAPCTWTTDFVDTIFYASPMHDIGKIGIPDNILLKPGPLSPSEWATMKTHTTLGSKHPSEWHVPIHSDGCDYCRDPS